MGGWPKDAEAKKVIKVLESEFGWTYDTATGNSAHVAGFLLCGHGCRIPVFSTASNTARALWKQARRCPHDRQATRVHW